MSNSSGEGEVARLRRQRLLLDLNNQIRSESAELIGGDAARPGHFVCECGDEDCTEHFVLPVALYDDLKANAVALLADEHPLSLARRARRAARDLHAAAQALRAQSQLQVARSKRIRSRFGDHLVIGVHLPSLTAASDLASHLSKPVALVGRADGVDVIVEPGGRLVQTVSEIRDWAWLYGLEGIYLSVRGETRTLAPLDPDTLDADAP
jgi:hypothetical protein